MPGRSYAGPIFQPAPAEVAIQERLRRHVRALAGDIGPRNVQHPQALEAAARYIQARLEELGFKVTPQEFVTDGRQVRNLATEIRGTTRPDEIIVVGAHYDTPEDTPGAADNARGVAALLEIADLLHRRRLARTVRIVFFVNEEPPYFQRRPMGSRVYAKLLRSRGENVVAMLSLETMGYFADAKRTQHYPPPFNFCYPSVGNFMGFVGNRASRALVERVVASFRQHAVLPSEGLAAPGWIPGVGWSDHWAFWKEGYPGVMVTDTAPFRNPNYHKLTDTPETLDYRRLTAAVLGLCGVITDLAWRPDLPRSVGVPRP
ncbi:MAG: M28 family peptidase [Deltaproteobacteria bacterium]|nr:M28 family peptidase [Deltaproteobacteria bacterium]